MDLQKGCAGLKHKSTALCRTTCTLLPLPEYKPLKQQHGTWKGFPDTDPNEIPTPAHWEERREKSILKSFWQNLADPQTFAFASFPSQLPATFCVAHSSQSNLFFPWHLLLIKEFSLSLGPLLAQSLQCVQSLPFPISLLNGCSQLCHRDAGTFTMMLCNFTENINA